MDVYSLKPGNIHNTMADLENAEKKIEEIIASESTPETSYQEETPSQPIEEKGEETPQVQEIEVLGKKYSNMDELAEDYKRLYDEFQKRIQEQTQQTTQETTPSDEYDDKTLQEAKRVLREKLGIIFADDDRIKNLSEKVQAFEEFMTLVYEEMMKQRDEMVIESLAKKYDGTHGEPKFDIEDIRQKVKQNPDLVVWVKVGDEFYPDLEATYKKIYAHHWESKSLTKPIPTKTEKGISSREIEEILPQEPKTREEKIKYTEKFFEKFL
ncbi:MAG: hypothetical protein KatS3mg096_774 [Candidatus Parcubacteria bacterium]|nr:MAG: hypothetical protein KatS3mg096_774 [Candidatus Parcubacteria bacterium]